jgi:hypothetical protein
MAGGRGQALPASCGDGHRASFWIAEAKPDHLDEGPAPLLRCDLVPGYEEGLAERRECPPDRDPQADGQAEKITTPRSWTPMPMAPDCPLSTQFAVSA